PVRAGRVLLLPGAGTGVPPGARTDPGRSVDPDGPGGRRVAPLVPGVARDVVVVVGHVRVGARRQREGAARARGAADTGARARRGVTLTPASTPVARRTGAALPRRTCRQGAATCRRRSVPGTGRASRRTGTRGGTR